MNEHEPYSSRAEHDFYKQLSAFDVDERTLISDIYHILGEVRQKNIERDKCISNYFIENMKRRRASDKEKI